jgi:tryptophan-rich sensory protein
MPEPTDPITQRMLASTGLGALVAEAEAVWRSRAGSDTATQDEPERPRWRPFEDAFPTFYQFTNRPPR